MLGIENDNILRRGNVVQGGEVGAHGAEGAHANAQRLCTSRGHARLSHMRRMNARSIDKLRWLSQMSSNIGFGDSLPINVCDLTPCVYIA